MNSYALISKYRRFLMGAAAVWLLLFHSAFTLSGHGFYRPVAYLFKTVGYGCVDIFMLLSGFGLYRSLAKSEAVLPFWQRRARRLLPSYYPVVLLWIGVMLSLSGITPKDILGNLTCAGWFIDPASVQMNWYPQAVWLFYLLAPPIAALIRTSRRPGLTTVALIGFSALCGASAFGRPQLLMALARFPVYILGFYLGRRAAEGADIRLIPRLGLYVLAAAGLGFTRILWCFPSLNAEHLLAHYGLYFYPMALAAPGLCLLLSRLAAHMDRCFLRPLVRGVAALGDCSFEVLLLQVLINELYSGLKVPVTTLTALLAVLLAAGLALVYGRFIRRLTPRLFPEKPGEAL